MSDNQDIECQNCGEFLEVEMWVEGECTRCGKHYWWEDIYDEDEDENFITVIWE